MVALFVKPRRHVPAEAPAEQVRLTVRGVDGDVHAGRGKRSLLLVDAGDLRDLGLSPGDLREQVTLDLPALMALEEGTRVEVGEAVLEITGPCEPCTHIGEHLGVDDANAFRERLKGRRGMLARVASVRGEGVVRVGDDARVLAPA